MKVIYEFDCHPESDDNYELRLIQKVHSMLIALSDISDYMRTIRKGWEEPTVDQMEEKISDIICESGIYEIE